MTMKRTKALQSDNMPVRCHSHHLSGFPISAFHDRTPGYIIAALSLA